MRHPAPQWSRDMSAMHTPSREEDRADGLGTVDVEEQDNGGGGEEGGGEERAPRLPPSPTAPLCIRTQ